MTYEELLAENYILRKLCEDVLEVIEAEHEIMDRLRKFISSL